MDSSQQTTAARSYWLGPPKLMLAGYNVAADFEHVNNEITCVTVSVPGAGLLASARELAAFYDLLVAGGRDVIRPLSSALGSCWGGVPHDVRATCRAPG